jgi:hypothetical protein
MIERIMKAQALLIFFSHSYNRMVMHYIYEAQRLNPALLFDYLQILQLRKQGIGSQDTTRKDLGLLEKLR